MSTGTTKTLEDLSRACLAYYTELFSASTPTTGPFVKAKVQGTHALMFYLYADAAMTKSIGAVEIKLHNWRPTERYTTST
jgi:hypothetical protein